MRIHRQPFVWFLLTLVVVLAAAWLVPGLWFKDFWVDCHQWWFRVFMATVIFGCPVMMIGSASRRERWKRVFLAVLYFGLAVFLALGGWKILPSWFLGDWPTDLRQWIAWIIAVVMMLFGIVEGQKQRMRADMMGDIHISGE